MSAAMWVRGFLQDDFGIAAAEIEWVQAGLENAGRRDKFPLNLPKGFPLTTGGPWRDVIRDAGRDRGLDVC
jgi:4,5-dihydroxyphthalate decarboxylase